MSENVRSYEEAVDLMIEFWVEKSFKTPLNQNNGDDSTNDMLFMLMNTVAMNAQSQVDDEKIDKFKFKLKELLMEVQHVKYRRTELDVDYHPNKFLSVACEYAEINTSCLPCKTTTSINDLNQVTGRYQYGGDWFTI